MILVMKLVKNLNYNLVVRSVLGMDKVGGEIGYVYGTTVGKVIKYGVNEKFGGSLG